MVVVDQATCLEPKLADLMESKLVEGTDCTDLATAPD